MKSITYLSLLCSCLLGMSCTPRADKAPTQTEARKTIGVFDGFGGAASCVVETEAALRLDPAFDVRLVRTSDLQHGVLDSIDALIIPGGGGSRQWQNLGERNRQSIREFVANGKGAVGICAGAYLFSSTPSYTCLSMNGAKAIDIEHDNRGHGIAKFTLTVQGRAWFPELEELDTCFVMYYEGPVFVPNPSDSIQYTTYAVMQSDVHEEGNAPADMTNGKPFFIANDYGRGRVFSSIAHPEGTPGMQWMIPRMVRWTLRMPIVPYEKAAVQPKKFDREILMSAEDLNKESELLKHFFYGGEGDKLQALDWLESHQSWDAKRYLQGALYDASPAVRMRAARYVARIGYLSYLPDMQAILQKEDHPQVADTLRRCIDELKQMLPPRRR